jgi:hypothetical protein
MVNGDKLATSERLIRSGIWNGDRGRERQVADLPVLHVRIQRPDCLLCKLALLARLPQFKPLGLLWDSSPKTFIGNRCKYVNNRGFSRRSRHLQHVSVPAEGCLTQHGRWIHVTPTTLAKQLSRCSLQPNPELDESIKKVASFALEGRLSSQVEFESARRPNRHNKSRVENPNLVSYVHHYGLFGDWVHCCRPRRRRRRRRRSTLKQWIPRVRPTAPHFEKFILETALLCKVISQDISEPSPVVALTHWDFSFRAKSKVVPLSASPTLVNNFIVLPAPSTQMNVLAPPLAELTVTAIAGLSATRSDD